MTKEQVQVLRDAGIPDSVIMDRILKDWETQMSAPSPENQDTATAEPEKAPEPEPASAPDERPDRTDEIIAAIQKLTGAVLGHNVNGSGIDTISQSADEVLGELFSGKPSENKKVREVTNGY